MLKVGNGNTGPNGIVVPLKYTTLGTKVRWLSDRDCYQYMICRYGVSSYLRTLIEPSHTSQGNKASH